MGVLFLLIALFFIFRDHDLSKKLKSLFGAKLITYQYEIDKDYHYDLKWSVNQVYNNLQSHVLFDGHYTIRPIAHQDDLWILVFNFTEIKNIEFNLLNQTLLTKENANDRLLNIPLVIQMENNGHIVKINYPKNASDEFRLMTKSLIAETQIIWPKAWDEDSNITPTKFESLEFTMNGLTQTNYQLIDKTNWKKIRQSYPELNLFQKISSDQNFIWKDSHLASLDAKESAYDNKGQLIFNESITIIEKSGRGILGPKLTMDEIKNFSTEHLNSPFESEKAREQQLKQRVGNLTVESMQQMLPSMALLPKSSRHNEFFWQATGLILQHPEYITYLESMFNSNNTTAESKAFILDILAGASSKESQSSLTKLLSAPQIKKLPTYPLLVQRLSFISTPEIETVNWSYNELKNSLKKKDYNNSDFANVYSLGEMIGKNYFNDENEKVAVEIRNVLIERLNKSNSPMETKAFIGALGNEGSKTAIKQILNFENNDNEQIRSAAILALRKKDLPETRDAVFQALTDKSLSVQEAALVCLDSYKKDEQFFNQLLNALRSDKVNSRFYGKIVGYVEVRPADDQDARDILKYIAAHEEADIELKNHVLDMLKS